MVFAEPVRAQTMAEPPSDVQVVFSGSEYRRNNRLESRPNQMGVGEYEVRDTRQPQPL